MASELYIRVTYTNKLAQNIDDEIQINSLNSLIELLYSYVPLLCKQNWNLILKNIASLQNTTGKIEIERKRFVENFNEILNISKNMPWQLSKKIKANSLPTLYLEKIQAIDRFLKQHKNAPYIILDVWCNTGGYANDFREIELKLEPL